MLLADVPRNFKIRSTHCNFPMTKMCKLYLFLKILVSPLSKWGNKNTNFPFGFIFAQKREQLVKGDTYLRKKLIAQRGARTHDPEIKSLMLYRLS